MMKAIVSDSYGNHQNLKLTNDHPLPYTNINEMPKNKPLLIQTLAVALAPGDARVLSGTCKMFNGPPSFPYVPGGDVCGIVEHIDTNQVKDDSELGYQVGDRIAARFTEGPRGALGEYATISTSMATKVPDNVSAEDAAVLASSGSIAYQLSKRFTDVNERVLIVGAGGGVGSHLCQFLKLKGYTFIAGVSKDPKRLLKQPISCNVALDYTQNDPYNLENWKKQHISEPFDTIVDLAGGGWICLLEQSENQDGLQIIKTAKEGGRYLTLTYDEALFSVDSIGYALNLFLCIPLFRAMVSRCVQRSKMPRYTFAMSLDDDVDLLKDTLKLASEGKIVACKDDRGPFEFTTEGAQEAFKIQESRHVRGKVVIKGPSNMEK